MNELRVPMLDLKRRDPEEVDALRAAFDRVLASGRFILGDEVEAFEAACATKLGATHAIGVSSGTDALIVALTALGVGAGDEVICPSFTFFATAGSIARLGATPVFADLAPEGFGIDARDVEAKITERTRAIVVVHLFGEHLDLEPVEAVARRHALPIIEDAAQAFGSTRAGSSAGTRGVFGCFSFFPTKTLGALGDAGLVVTADRDLAERARRLRSHGAVRKHEHLEVGGNFRIDALQAALLAVTLERFDARVARRREHAGALEAALRSTPLVLPIVSEGHTLHHYVVRSRERDELRAFLAERGVDSERYYSAPLHKQRCFARGSSLPNTERAAAEALALPIFAELTGAEIERVGAAIAAFFATRR